MLDQDKILSFMKMNGPTTPTAVAKNIKSDLLLASALLSDLSAQNKLKVSKLKIGGGSPLYYLQGQEDQLFNFAESNFNPKDYHVLLQLKERKLLREKELELLAKVALRGMKDFAVPLNVNIHGQTELFWKWHLLSNEEANKMIGDFVNAGQEIPKEEGEATEQKPEVKEEPKVEPKVEEPKVEEKREVPKTESKDSESAPKEQKPEDKEVSKVKEAPKEEPKVEEKKEEPKPEVKEEPKQEVKKAELEVKKEEKVDIKEEQKKLPTSEKKSFMQKVKDKVVKKRKTVDDEFLPQLEEFFTNLNIKMDQKETMRKNAEMNFTLKVPSVVGQITYFCKAKNKSRCDEKDLSAAYMEAQAKRLPLLFLYTNELNKKSWEMMESGAFENVVVKKVE